MKKRSVFVILLLTLPFLISYPLQYNEGKHRVCILPEDTYTPKIMNYSGDEIFVVISNPNIKVYRISHADMEKMRYMDEHDMTMCLSIDDKTAWITDVE